MKLRKALGAEPGRIERALEVGAGTGYFSINLTQAGVIGSATATDISPGMLDRLAATAEELGLDVETVPADAEQLPFADGAFDLVLGHAVLHHLPSPRPCAVRVPPGAATGRHAGVHGRALTPRRPARGPAQASRSPGGAGMAARCSA